MYIVQTDDLPVKMKSAVPSPNLIFNASTNFSTVF